MPRTLLRPPGRAPAGSSDTPLLLLDANGGDQRGQQGAVSRASGAEFGSEAVARLDPGRRHPQLPDLGAANGRIPADTAGALAREPLPRELDDLAADQQALGHHHHNDDEYDVVGIDPQFRDEQQDNRSEEHT